MWYYVLRDWCKTIVTALENSCSYNSFALNLDMYFQNFQEIFNHLRQFFFLQILSNISRSTIYCNDKTKTITTPQPFFFNIRGAIDCDGKCYLGYEVLLNTRSRTNVQITMNISRMSIQWRKNSLLKDTKVKWKY